MEFSVHSLQKGKLAVHIVQAVFIVVSWILDIVVFRSDADIDGRLGWHFGVVCFPGKSSSFVLYAITYHRITANGLCSASSRSFPSFS
jgi:hypothetical protein